MHLSVPQLKVTAKLFLWQLSTDGSTYIDEKFFILNTNNVPVEQDITLFELMAYVMKKWIINLEFFRDLCRS